MLSKKEQTKARILQTAMQAFGKNSYEQVSISFIAQKAEVAKGTVYLYYESKEQLYVECVRQCYQQIYEHMSKKCFPEAADAETILLNYYAAFNEFLHRNQLVGDLYFATFFYPVQSLAEDIKAAALPMMQFNRRYLTCTLKRFPAKYAINTEDIADIMLEVGGLLVQKCRQQHWLNDEQQLYQLQNQFRQMITIFLHGILQ